jgi:hypothetical protein
MTKTKNQKKEQNDAYLQMLKESKQLADAIINQKQLSKTINLTK